MKKENFRINDFIGIYDEVDNDHFGLGKVIALDEENIIISAVDPAGLSSGLALYKIESIYKYEKDTLYCNKIKRLMEYKKSKLMELQFSSNNIALELLEIAKKSKMIVEIELLNSHEGDITGIVCNLNEDVCEIDKIDYLGKNDGKYFINIEDITLIKYNELRNSDLEILRNTENGSINK